MGAEFEAYISRLERLLSLLRALAEQFVASRKEFVAMDLDGIYRCVSEQEELCRRIARLRPSKNEPKMSVARLEDPGAADRVGSIRRELREAHAELRRLNQIQAAYLRRSNRTIEVLLNAVGNHALTYSRPARSAFTQSLGVGG